ncbi:hypothetical protein BD626DRAFT_484194 [Schizophyllum amplum]|uniref:Uncharacterized protein n=1 Tax=Schizophyllum amplum TaxID=97359 RepID=A0A550CQ38_9AGAR|nr:hypothetical protein BD626DRAFT_484194 [Auriculariopsis ampla]
MHILLGSPLSRLLSRLQLSFACCNRLSQTVQISKSAKIRGFSRLFACRNSQSPLDQLLSCCLCPATSRRGRT